MTVQSTGGDVSGEPATIVVTAPGGATETVSGTVGTSGAFVADVTFDPATPPADFEVAFSTRDHAGNPCELAPTYRVVYAGCPIVVTAPVTTVTTDADGNGANGAQVDLVLDIDEACVGRPVTSDCGSNDVGGTVGSGGATTLRADVCGGVPCESSELCTVRVTSLDGIETTAGVNLAFDNQAPSVAVQVAQPGGVACGGTVTPAQDVDLGTAGTQIVMRVVSPSAADRQLRADQRQRHHHDARQRRRRRGHDHDRQRPATTSSASPPTASATPARPRRAGCRWPTSRSPSPARPPTARSAPPTAPSPPAA